ncbi:TonB-dependent receptor [Chitinophaga sp. Mgbs1]|uniref:TonB-dependent receptor n=1 Tax=Chitinophaga solisilvae TaxID=1233460 RepID=A0A433W9D8_9BACT|nr:TonB-dependent receptor [Chitinophaga solisilvae]
MTRLLLLLTWLLTALPALAQHPAGSVRGEVTDQEGRPVNGATITLQGIGLHTVADRHGRFRVEKIAPGSYILRITAVGYATAEQQVTIAPGVSAVIAIRLQPAAYEVKQVEVAARSAAQAVKEQVFAADVLDVKQLRDRSTDMNRLLDAMPGIRVRESGGLGSSFNYSIHGLSGKAVRFFLDGVPMETFGSGFSISNFPLNMLDRIEVYKGVTPAWLGGDALGGAINLVTRKDIRNYIDASYSYGSYQTHKTAVSGRWRQQATGFTFQAGAAYNYSRNNYQVWGPTVEIADENFRPVPGEHRFRRFNDDYSSLTVKAEAGFTNKPWADQLLLGVNVSELHKGIQTGRTMAFVYGDVRYKENFVMPTLRYTKQDLFTKGLRVDVFASMNRLEGTTIDTGTRKYDWSGKVVEIVEGELGGAYTQRSRYTFTDKTALAIANASYTPGANQTISLAYTLNNTRRQGKDDIARAQWTIPFLEPQQLTRHISSLSYEARLFSGKWTNVFFVKNFSYKASANIYDYNEGAQKEVIKIRGTDNAWGIGYGTKIDAGHQMLLKFSAENTSRLPDAAELLGDGNTILNAPKLKPERSLNFNTSVQKTFDKKQYRLGMELGVFYRDVKDLIWLGEGTLYGTARYENISRIRSAGAELSVHYSNRKWLELSANGTWQDIRNRQRYMSNGATNLMYDDKMKNMPSLMANAEIRLRYPDMLRKGEHLSFYVNTHYVEKYYLNWPSMAEKDTKMAIPQQFVQDAGLTYSFRDNRCSVTIECRNLLNKQVYDNFLLQKPGRFNSIQLRYFFHNKPN